MDNVGLVSALALFGTRSPEAPMLPDAIEGPFVGASTGIATGATTAIELIKGTSPMLVADYKLRNYAGIAASAGNPTGVLYVNAIGFDLTAKDNSDADLEYLMATWSVVWAPQGATRAKVIPLLSCGRIFAGNTVSTTATGTTATRVAAPQHVAPLYRIPGGPFRVNLQSDTFQLQYTGASAGSLTSTVAVGCRIDGVYVTQGASTALGLLQAPASCDANVPAILAQRAALNMISAGGAQY